MSLILLLVVVYLNRKINIYFSVKESYVYNMTYIFIITFVHSF